MKVKNKKKVNNLKMLKKILKHWFVSVLQFFQNLLKTLIICL